ARVHYRDQGNIASQTLLLLHGAASSLLTWEGWVKALSGRYRIISVDLPGHGMTGRVAGDDYSDAAALAFLKAFTDKLELRRFVLAGNSWGGELAGAFAIENPRRVTHLILIDAWGAAVPEGERKIPLAFQLMGKPVIGDLLAWVTPRSIAAERVHSVYGDPGKVSDALIDSFYDMVRHEGNRQARKMRARLPRGLLLEGRLKEIRQPTLIMWGGKDGLLPPAMGEQFDKDVPHSTLHVFENAGHVPMEEIPDESAAVAEAFISENQ
ncbi:MAG: alpha/beta hydrolase, partial [Alphaproteobacteria bacterium]|nr:alpha/beta hydrolase [Alphaproteobacteria bacterium]